MEATSVASRRNLGATERPEAEVKTHRSGLSLKGASFEGKTMQRESRETTPWKKNSSLGNLEELAASFKRFAMLPPKKKTECGHQGKGKTRVYCRKRGHEKPLSSEGKKSRPTTSARSAAFRKAKGRRTTLKVWKF